MIEYAFETDTLFSPSYAVRVVDHFPTIQYGSKQYTHTSIPGRQGTLTETNGTYTDTVVVIDCDITSLHNTNIDVQYQEFISRLLKSKELRLDGLEDYFFQIKTIEISNYDRYSDISIAFMITFICDPGRYTVSGKHYLKLNQGAKIVNSWSECEPLYKIKGNGLCTLDVNGYQVSVNLSNEIMIDVALMNAYIVGGINANQQIKGDYEKLRLKPGVNTITVSSGFSIEVMPRWRWLQ